MSDLNSAAVISANWLKEAGSDLLFGTFGESELIMSRFFRKNFINLEFFPTVGTTSKWWLKISGFLLAFLIGDILSLLIA